MADEPQTLHLLWTTGDPITAEHMVMMYATNSKLNDWWDEVDVLIWGASQILVTENEAVQTKLEIARQAGVKFRACISCANNLGTLPKLEALDIPTYRLGPVLTELLQSGEKVLSV
jgi:hypothetical protein